MPMSLAKHYNASNDTCKKYSNELSCTNKRIEPIHLYLLKLMIRFSLLYCGYTFGEGGCLIECHTSGLCIGISSSVALYVKTIVSTV